MTRGVDDTPLRLARLDLPLSLAGESVLDIGAWDGFFSFEAERRGASRVVAADYYSWHGTGWGTGTGKAGFELAQARGIGEASTVEAGARHPKVPQQATGIGGLERRVARVSRGNDAERRLRGRSETLSGSAAFPRHAREREFPRAVDRAGDPGCPPAIAGPPAGREEASSK